jgi:hypothetical protein
MNAITELRKPAGPVRAHVTRQQGHVTISLPDGSMVLTVEDLAVLGNGSADVGRRQLTAMIAAERGRKVRESVTATRPASVRISTAKDDEQIVELLRLDCEENAAIVAPFDEEKIRRAIPELRARASVIGVIDDKATGKIVALVGLVAMQWWWSNQWFYQEQPMFVHPDHRKSHHARDLLQFQEWWVDDMSRRFGYRIRLLCGVLGVKDIWLKTAMYKRRFRMVGSAFIYPGYDLGGL